MRWIALVAACLVGPAAADVWSPMEFYIAKGNPDQGDVQTNGDVWTFRRGSYNGPLLTGIRGTLACEAGFGLWGRPDGAFGFMPGVGPRLSPDEDLDEGQEARIPDFDGLLVFPSDIEDGFLVFTAPGPETVPTLTLRGEMLYGGFDGVLLTVKTRIGGQTHTWLNQGQVTLEDEGFQEWVLFQNDHPQMQKGDKLWVQVNRDGAYQGDWANVSLESSACYPDCTGDGVLDLFDFLCFVNGFNAGDVGADCDGNGGLDLFDFLCFVNAFNAGC